MKVDLKTYNRSTNNKTRTFTNTQSVGTLVPSMREYCQTGDTWEIELHADVKTHPTVGPLFGSFKFQNDLFLCPIRLYHAWLHNNKLDIGNDMASVKLPILECSITDDDVPANTSVVVLALNHNIGRPLTNAEINSIQIFAARYPDMTGQIGTTISNLGTIAGNTTTQLTLKLNKLESYSTSNAIIVKVEQFPTQRTLQSFPLKNIDEIREKILYHNSTTAYIVDGAAKAPYGLVVSHASNNKLNTTYPQYGLAIKTYQSDIFNNWLNTTTVNNITSKTNISTASGSFSIDTLVTSKKIWEMLNKIAIAGGTYEDWLNTMFTNSYHKNTEIPVYIGGMSQEIVFQEILSNSATSNLSLLMS